MDHKHFNELTGGGITHHFGGGVYAKQIEIPAHSIIGQHAHKFSHLSILASGRVAVTNGLEVKEYTGPACLEIKAGIAHSVLALTDCVWFCVHATDETDSAKIDQVLIEGT